MSDVLAVMQTEESIKEIRKLRAELPALTTDIRNLSTSVSNFNRGLRSANLRQYADAMQNMTTIGRQFAQVQQQISVQMERLSRVEANNARAAAENARARAESARAIREESRAREQAAREAANLTRRNNEQSSSYRALVREMNQVRSKARDYQADIFNLNRRLRDGTISQAEYNRKLQEFTRNARLTTEQAKRLQEEIRRINRSTQPDAQKSGALFGRVTDIIKGLSVVNIMDNIASSFYKMGVNAFETSKKLETLRLAQLSVFKTSTEVGRQNEFLEGIAQRYGIELLSLTEAYTKFAASAQGTTLEGKKTQDVFDAVTRSSAKLGVSTDETNGILRALGQMMSKGKVQAEELRGQLGDRMAGAFRLFADGMGVSTSKLDEMLKKGEVLAEDVLPKFANQLNKKYQLGINEEINTTQASLTRLTNAWTIFVDAVENRTGLVSSSVSSITAVLAGMLKEITPSETITAIQNEQVELNKLGILLKQNWNDTKRRKELLDQIIAINPYFLDGLDREKATLEQISDRLRLTNEQYVQKIILQNYEDELNEILEEQAERVRLLAQAYADNAVVLNTLSDAQQKVIDKYTSGTMTYNEATEALKKLGGNWQRAYGALYYFQQAIGETTITSKGYIRTTKDLNNQAAQITNTINGQLKVIDKLTGANGNLLGVNTSLINSNYLLGNSYNYLSQKEELAARQKDGDYKKAIKAAREAKEAFAQFDGFFFDAKTAKNTGKKVGEWDIVDDKLVKRQPQTLPDKAPKKYTGAKLDGKQKDFMMTAQGERDSEIATLKKKRLDLLINQEEYWQEYENIIVRYGNKIQGYLKGKNAKEIQVEGAAYKKAIEAMEQNMKERYDLRSKKLEEENRIEMFTIERQSNNLEKLDFLTDEERVSKQIEIDSQSIQILTKYYDEQIKLAENSAEDVLSWERKKFEEIGKLEDARDKKVRSLPELISKSWETQFSSDQSSQAISIEERKRLILADKRLTIEERTFRLSQLDQEQQIETNKLEIIRLQIEKGRIQAQAAIRLLRGESPAQTEAEKAALLALDAQISTSVNNIELAKKAKEELGRDRWKSVADKGTEMLRGLGMDNLADTIGSQFDDLYKKMKDGALKVKDVAVLAAAAMADALSSMVNNQKETTIAAIDEQLKYSQETADQELDFINKRLEAINSLGDLTKEQQDERNKLESEARSVKEQQRMREKIYENQKARAEQRASAQQALINGALGATMALATMAPPYSYVMAGLAAAFGIAQSVSIMSKDPIPQYWKGRNDGPAEMALTQERGREIIADKNDNILSLGSDRGSQKTWLNKGDKVYTAEQTRNFLRNYKEMPKIGQKVFHNMALNSLRAPVVNMVVKSGDGSREIVEGLKKIDDYINKHSTPNYQKVNGKIIKYHGNKTPVIVGTYDLKTGEETWYQ